MLLLNFQDALSAKKRRQFSEDYLQRQIASTRLLPTVEEDASSQEEVHSSPNLNLALETSRCCMQFEENLRIAPIKQRVSSCG